MSNRVARCLVFLLFTWVVLNSSVFFIIPHKYDGWEIIYRIGTNLCYRSCKNFWEYVVELIGCIFSWNAPFYILFTGFWIIPWYLWWKRQTLWSAWLLAGLGGVFGPGGAWATKQYGWGVEMVWWDGFLSMNSFYILLIIIYFLHQRYFPHNRLYDRLAAILKWPCLRT